VGEEQFQGCTPMPRKKKNKKNKQDGGSKVAEAPSGAPDISEWPDRPILVRYFVCPPSFQKVLLASFVLRIKVLLVSKGEQMEEVQML
jgi:hypothetical protein